MAIRASFCIRNEAWGLRRGSPGMRRVSAGSCADPPNGGVFVVDELVQALSFDRILLQSGLRVRTLCVDFAPSKIRAIRRNFRASSRRVTCVPTASSQQCGAFAGIRKKGNAIMAGRKSVDTNQIRNRGVGAQTPPI